VLIGIIADTHMKPGQSLPPAVADTLSKTELILHAGDIVSEEALDEIESLGPQVMAIHGNMDSEGLQSRLPAERRIGFGSVNVAMVHDAGPEKGRLERMRERFPEAHAVIFGHSHMPALERGEEDFQIFNPGSPLQRRKAPKHSFGLALLEGGRLTFKVVELP
jgi:putative phosphoesterase